MLITEYNAAGAAVADLKVAARLLHNVPVLGAVPLNELRGFKTCEAAGEGVLDAYCASIDAGLTKLPGLRSRGYRIERAS